MAAPIALEDLEKLKSFVQFVEKNPYILNLPQLDFLKKLIEKFGGVVPDGDFQMPAGGKCPFGGDVKSETKPSPPPAAEPEEDEEDETPEMEAESEESEVELDMEANNIPLLEPNVLYLDQKPPKIVKIKKEAKISTKMKPTKRTLTKTMKKSKKPSKVLKIQEDYIVKEECITNNAEQKIEVDPNDPLYTPQIEVKCELYEEGIEEKMEIKSDKEDNFDKDYDQYGGFDDDDSSNDEKDELFESKLKRNEITDDDDDDDEDEPLIMLNRSKGRPRKYPIKEGRVKTPLEMKCNLLCKLNCCDKFTEEQRQSICNYCWSLKREDRLDFIRKHIKSKQLPRITSRKTNKRTINCCYYLKDYTSLDDPNESDLIRVCRRYFEKTLCLTEHYIQKAVDGYELEMAKDALILTDQIKANREKLLLEKKAVRQILDPETGTLITIDPNDKTKKPLAQKPTIKRKRRKPGEPEPERFPKPIKCSLRCIHKCHETFTEEERKQICDTFWSMDYNRRKDYLLERIEIKEIETKTAPEFRITNRPPRTFHTRFFLRTGLRGENKRVCKHFLSQTLCASRNFISDAIEFADKNTGYYTGSDKRGKHNNVHNKISPENQQIITDHIHSYPTWVPNKKSKTKYLHYSLSVKKMFLEYKDKCLKAQHKSLSSKCYYNSFHKESLQFLANPVPKKGCGFLTKNPNISHYTGEEAGGFWSDPKGEKLDLRLFDPAKSINTFQHPVLQQQHHSMYSHDSSLTSDQPTTSSSSLQLLNYRTAAAAHQLAHFIDPTANSRILSASFLNPNLYDNLP